LAQLHGCRVFHDETGWLAPPWNGGENLQANANSGGASLAGTAFQVVRQTWSEAEKSYCNLGTATCDRERASHFTQVVSSLTSYVGCATWNFEDTFNSDDWMCAISVCRYAANGNQYLGNQFLGAWPTPYARDEDLQKSCNQDTWEVGEVWRPWSIQLQEQYLNPTPAPTSTPTHHPTVTDRKFSFVRKNLVIFKVKNRVKTFSDKSDNSELKS